METGEKIRKLRIERGLEQKELAKMVGITPSMVCQIERGSKAVTIPLGKEFARVFGVTLNEIAG